MKVFKQHCNGSIRLHDDMNGFALVRSGMDSLSVKMTPGQRSLVG